MGISRDEVEKKRRQETANEGEERKNNDNENALLVYSAKHEATSQTNASVTYLPFVFLAIFFCSMLAARFPPFSRARHAELLHIRFFWGPWKQEQYRFFSPAFGCHFLAFFFAVFLLFLRNGREIAFKSIRLFSFRFWREKIFREFSSAKTVVNGGGSQRFGVGMLGSP